jgi:hypothetical protein
LSLPDLFGQSSNNENPYFSCLLVWITRTSRVMTFFSTKWPRTVKLLLISYLDTSKFVFGR